MTGSFMWPYIYGHRVHRVKSLVLEICLLMFVQWNQILMFLYIYVTWNMAYQVAGYKKCVSPFGWDEPILPTFPVKSPVCFLLTSLKSFLLPPFSLCCSSVIDTLGVFRWVVRFFPFFLHLVVDRIISFLPRYSLYISSISGKSLSTMCSMSRGDIT